MCVRWGAVGGVGEGGGWRSGTQTCRAGGWGSYPWCSVSVGLPALALLLFILVECVANAINTKKNAN